MRTTFSALCSVLSQDEAYTILKKLRFGVTSYLSSRECDHIFKKMIIQDGEKYLVTTYSFECDRNILHFGVWRKWNWLCEDWFETKMRIWRTRDEEILQDITVAIDSRMAID